MIIKKIVIKNFRSYYGTNTFDIGEGLTLIIGSNGDGKTTFYDALAWLFRTDGQQKDDLRFVSKKRASELAIDNTDEVMVSMEYYHAEEYKKVEKKFIFRKINEKDIESANESNFMLSVQHATQGEDIDGIYFEHDFPAIKRRYCMFQGEGELNILQNSNSLKQLVDDFSDVRNFEPYKYFLEKYAIKQAETIRDKMLSSDEKHKKKAQSLRGTISLEEQTIGRIERELRNKHEEVQNFTKLLKDLEKNKESSKELVACNHRINTLNDKKIKTLSRVKDNYSVRLLDELWILLGFESIAREFTAKVAKISKERRTRENEYQQQLGAQKLAAQMELGFVPLSVHVPDEKVMREMLDDEVCKVCGRPAPKGSDAYNFMKMRLQNFLDSLNVDDANDKSLYKNDFIVQLDKRDTTLNNNLARLSKMRSEILDDIEFNNRMIVEARNIAKNIEDEEAAKRRILAHTDGLTEEQLTSELENITQWSELKNTAFNRARDLQIELDEHKRKLEDAQDELSKISKNSVAKKYGYNFDVLRHILLAFENAQKNNKEKLLTLIEEYANLYLDELNKNDFKGRIDIRTSGQQVEAALVDADGSTIMDPNQALLTTKYMSVLFAISKLAIEKDNEHQEMPLIFDAPTSSFTKAKESEFFDIISKMGKQVIIITKSFLEDDKDGKSILDEERIKHINGSIYHISKKDGYNDKILSTIQTVSKKIK